MKTAELIVVEFSLSQKSFHKHTVKSMCEHNLKTILARKQTDYIPVLICDNEDTADNFILSIKEGFKDYSMYKTTGGDTIVPVN